MTLARFFRKRLLILFAFVLLLVPFSHAQTKNSHRGSPQSKRTQDVRGYKTKKGKTVKPYKRKPPN